MSWSLTGSYIETCSCELMCPCNLSFSHGATYDFCRVCLVFNIREGAVDDTDIDGCKVALIADTPKVMTDGKWRVGVFIDDGATQAQFDTLVQVFSGQLGGPMAGLAPLIGEMLGVERATIHIEEDGLRHSVRIDDAVASRSRTSSRSEWRPASRSASPGCSTPPVRTSRWPRPPGPGSTPSASSTKGRPACRSPTSPGPPDPMNGVRSVGLLAGEGLRPAFTAARAQLGLVICLVGLAVVGWWWTLDAMRGMNNGPWTGLGSFGWFVGTWVVMMAAMMFPSVTPTVALYAKMNPTSRLVPAVFAGGYLFTWAAAGAAAYAIGVVLARVFGDALAWSHAGRPLAGATLVVAAGYELTPFKNACLGKCRSPLGAILGSWRGGWWGALRMGAQNGAWCVGCCWALMASLFALGVMSVSWMALVAALVAVKKLLPWRRTATYGTALVPLTLGVLVLAAPDASPGLRVPGPDPVPVMSPMGT